MKINFRLPNKGTYQKPSYPNPSNIYVRVGNAIAPTGYEIDPKYWKFPKRKGKKTGSGRNPHAKRPISQQGLKSTFKPTKLKPKELRAGKKRLSTKTLAEINVKINERDELDHKGIPRDTKWLKSVINEFHNIKDEDGDDFFEVFFNSYIERNNANTFKPILERFKLFQTEEIKRKLVIKELDADFSNQYANWMIKEEFMPFYIREELSHIKRVLSDAKVKGKDIGEADWKLWAKPKDKKKPKPVYLTLDEIQSLYDLKIDNKKLDNARRVLIVSCETSLRYSDLWQIQKSRVKNNKISIKAKKTDEDIVIPILDRVIDLLTIPLELGFRNTYNKLTKEVCKLAGIDTVIEARKRGVPKKTRREGRKQEFKTLQGNFPKYEVVSSHVGRRSFCSNYYGKIPTPILMGISGHAEESTFLKYIGKTTEDHADSFLELVKALDKK